MSTIHAPYGEEIDNRQLFARQLDEVQEYLRGQNIEFRIFGSLAMSAYIDEPGDSKLDFNRSGAYTLDQRVPDVDLLVPQYSLKTVQTYSDFLRKSSFPVNVELLFPEFYIDYHAEQDESFLMHRKLLRVGVDSRLFEPVIRPFLDTHIVTVDPRTLFHTYVTCGGILRQKDLPRVVTLARRMLDGTIPSAHSEREYAQFHDFISQRKHGSPMFTPLKRMCETVGNMLPDQTRRCVIHYLLPGVRRMLKAT